MIGLAFAFGWTPCIGPILAAILAVAASEQTVAQGAGLLAVYSLGLGIPFVIAAFAIEPFAAFLRASSSYLHRVEQAMGALLVLTGIAFLTGSVNQMSVWLLETFPGARQDRLARKREARREGGLLEGSSNARLLQPSRAVRGAGIPRR